MNIKGICTPALIYLIYSVTQIILDTSNGMFNTALIKFFISIIITIVLNYLCVTGYKVISWIIVFIPFILMTIITSILLLGLGLDPFNGKLKTYNPNKKIAYIDIRERTRNDMNIYDCDIERFPHCMNTKSKNEHHDHSKDENDDDDESQNEMDYIVPSNDDKIIGIEVESNTFKE